MSSILINFKTTTSTRENQHKTVTKLGWVDSFSSSVFCC